jgi:carbamoyl-phosphate synthase large subunit
MRVLIAGIGGASLGTELLKALGLADRYRIVGCDVSPLAFGHYSPAFEQTFLADPDDYASSVLDICRKAGIACILPGGEEPLRLLCQAADRLHQAGVALAANAPAVVERFADKETTFQYLGALGIPVPRTVAVAKPEDVRAVPCPCVVKPATESGGSSMVFVASDHREAALYAAYLKNNGKKVLVQEYIPEGEGEFTVGVLSRPGGRLVGSVALRRLFHTKLSVMARGRAGLISSGNSQGHVDDYPAVRAAAELIAQRAGSEGPLNVQGRLRDGVFVPFEVNPRFSASTYLRALAGFNEVDLYLRALRGESDVRPDPLRPGYYLRSFSEVYVPTHKVVA